MENLLNTAEYTCRVSSTLQKNVKEYGKKFMFDGKEETCWSSDQGTPQFIVLDFQTPITFAEFSIQFQGGFAGKECTIHAGNYSEPFYPDDVNKTQSFKLKVPQEGVTQVKIVIESSTDFFGRIIIYSLELFQ